MSFVFLTTLTHQTERQTSLENVSALLVLWDRRGVLQHFARAPPPQLSWAPPPTCALRRQHNRRRTTKHRHHVPEVQRPLRPLRRVLLPMVLQRWDLRCGSMLLQSEDALLMQRLQERRRRADEDVPVQWATKILCANI